MDSAERVLVDIDRKGSPSAVGVRQELLVRGKGDYFLTVPAPLGTVRAGPDSQSEPGQRRNGILWQGFSPGRRRLVADAVLPVNRTAESLPLRLRLTRSNRFLEVEVENVTAISAQTFEGSAEPLGLARVLDLIRSRAPLPRQSFATVSCPVLVRPTRVGVALRVEGELRSDGRTARFAQVLSGSRSLTARLPLLGSGGAMARVLVRATPVRTGPELEPPAASWVAAVQSGRAPRPRAFLRLTVEALLRSARLRQYQNFLVNPDPVGRATVVYIFRTAKSSAAPTPTKAAGSDGGVLLVAVLVLGALLVLAALVVLWAHL